MPEEKKQRTTVSEAEEIELEYKRLQIEVLKHQIGGIEAIKAANKMKIEKMLDDMKQADREMAHRQLVCKHRKGGKNNQFAKGNDENRSIIQNTFPLGEICIMCTRCFKTVWRPDAALRKTDPKQYAAMLEIWKEWASWPTDNTPSGSKIFEKVA